MKVLAVLSEQFFKDGNRFKNQRTSTKFVQNTFGHKNVIITSPVTTSKSDNYSSSVEYSNFEELPYFDSIKSFMIKSLRNKLFLSNYTARCNEIIDKYPDHIIWLRNPSIGSLIFGICAMRKNRNIINHMCANAMNGWDNKKYNPLEKALGFLFSKIIYLMVRRISKNDNTINVCTGDELYNICRSHNKETYQFVDVMLEKDGDFDLTTRVQDDNFNFLYVGRIVLDKGIEDLCLAFNEVNNKKSRLNIVGDGKDLENLKRKFSINENITFHGQLKNEKLPDFFINSYALIVPSKNSYEGFPRVIMEAWLYQLPVIAYDTGGVKAFLKDGVNGLLVRKNDVEGLASAMNKLTNKKVYNKLCIGAKDAAKISSFSYWSSEIKRIAMSRF